MLEFCIEYGLTITSTLFKQKAIQDNLETSKDAHDVLHTRVMPIAVCCTNHRLVRAKTKITIKATVKGRRPQTKKLHISQLLIQRGEFNRELEARFCRLESSNQDLDP